MSAPQIATALLRRIPARGDDRLPSVVAAESVARASTARQSVLALLRTYGPMTDETLVEKHAEVSTIRRTPQRLRTARAELVADGYVREARTEDGVVHVRLASGYHGTVWESA